LRSLTDITSKSAAINALAWVYRNARSVTVGSFRDFTASRHRSDMLLMFGRSQSTLPNT
jgi:hypothetical protein